MYFLHSEFIGTHWHNGTSKVDHTSFNGDQVGLVGLSIFFCLLVFYTPLLMKVVGVVAVVVVADAVVVMMGMVMVIIRV